MLYEIPHKKDDIHQKTIKNEDFVLDQIFYTKGNKKRPIGLNIVNRKFKGIKDGKINDHDIVETVSKSKYPQHSLLLLYHWYERRYNVNIIQGENNIVTHQNRKVKRKNTLVIIPMEHIGRNFMKK